MKSLAFVFTLLLSVPAFAEDTNVFYGECGLSHKFTGFEFTHANFKFSMPKQGVILRDSVQIHKNEKTYDWWTLSSGAEFHKSSDFLIVRIWSTDCVDLSSSQVFLISNTGQLLLEQYEWTQN